MQPTLYLICGLPGSGKTSKAKEIETQQSAIRFTPDEWIIDVFGTALSRERRDAVRQPIEDLQWSVAKRVLSLNCNVVLDWGFWSRAERTRYKQEAEGLGAKVEIIFLDIPLEELWSRISHRPESQAGTLHITKQELEQWAEIFETPATEELPH